MNNNENINYPIPKKTYTVLARCATYNQSKYICDTLNGFAMQRTNFPFVCFVMDDASTDDEQEVIKEWMEHECDMNKAEIIEIPTSTIIIVPHKTNFSCTFAFYLLKQNLYGTGKKEKYIVPWREKCKYIAICEGDDYWTDPYKLQKQVDFLENHPEYVLSHTAFHYHIEYENNQLKDSHKSTSRNLEIIKNDESNIICHILNNNDYRIQTATVLFKKKIYELVQEDKIKDNEPRFLMGDTPLWVRLCQYGKIHFIEDSTANYRLHMGSACRNTDKIKKLRFTLSCSEMQVYYVELFNIDNRYTETIRKNFKRKLFIYKLFDHSYKPIVSYKIKTINDYIFYRFLINKHILMFIKPFYTLYQKIKYFN